MIMDVFEIYFLKIYATWMISQPLLSKACKIPPVLQHSFLRKAFRGNNVSVFHTGA